MGRLVAIKRDGARQSALALKRPPEKRFGCRDIMARSRKSTVFPSLSTAR
jgi:hypothetical protein